MDLSAQVDRRLQPGTVTADCGDRGALIEVVDADRLGVVVKGVRVSRAGRPLEEAVVRLPEALSEALRRRFHLTEADLALGGAVARTGVEDQTFFELRTTGPDATLERWQVREGARERLAFPLTREDLGRVVRAMQS